MSTTFLMWASIIAIGVLGVPFILIWWRDMDRWANAEHKRFKPKPPPKDEERIVVPTQHPMQSAGPTILPSEHAGVSAGASDIGDQGELRTGAFHPSRP